MQDVPSYLYGNVAWPKPMDRMTAILKAGGLAVDQGKFAICINDCEDFRFTEYGGDLGEPCIEACANSVIRMIADGKLVAQALAKSRVEHRFEIYDENDECVHVIVNGESLGQTI